MQFLSEAVVMSLMGGAIGLVFGMISSVLVARLLQWPTAVPLSAGLIAFLFSACVGKFFGYYPAWKTATLPPLQTPRYDEAKSPNSHPALAPLISPPPDAIFASI